MKKALVIMLFICSNLNTYSQDKSLEELYPINELEVVNSDLFSALDSIIQMRNKIKAYKKTSFFTMEFNEDDDKKDLIFIRAYEKIVYNCPNILGYFDYKKNFIIVMGDSIDTSVFQKTNKERNFDIGLPEIEKRNGKPIVNQYETFAVWSVRYNKLRGFRVLSFYTDNRLDCWFNNIDEDYDEKQ